MLGHTGRLLPRTGIRSRYVPVKLLVPNKEILFSEPPGKKITCLTRQREFGVSLSKATNPGNNRTEFSLSRKENEPRVLRTAYVPQAAGRVWLWTQGRVGDAATCVYLPTLLDTTQQRGGGNERVSLLVVQEVGGHQNTFRSWKIAEQKRLKKNTQD